MTGEEFCACLRANLPRATDKEWQAIRREVTDHMEDHAALLAEGGFPLEEAQSRAVESMGAPEEMGRALNAQLSTVWLVVSRVSMVCIVLLCWALLTSLPTGRVGDSLEARWAPERSGNGLKPHEGYVSQPVDVRMEVKSDILRVYRVGVNPDTLKAEVALCVYDQSPLGYVDHGMTDALQAQAPDGTWARFGGGAGGNAGAWYAQMSNIPVEQGQEVLRLRYDRYGENFTLEIPLIWEEVAP